MSNGLSPKVKLSIGGVDGETNVYIECRSGRAALEFLQKHDHEGSSVGITIEYEDPEEGYEALRKVWNRDVDDERTIDTRN